MRRSLRRLFTLFATASLFVCVGSGVLWVRSLHYYDSAYRVRDDIPNGQSYETEVVSGEGCILVRRDKKVWHPSLAEPIRATAAQPRWHFRVEDGQSYRWAGGGLSDSTFGGFGYSKFRRTPASGSSWQLVSSDKVRVPYRFVMLCSAALPLRWAIDAFTLRRRRAGLCERCGYDVRETPDRCPECGLAPTAG